MEPRRSTGVVIASANDEFLIWLHSERRHQRGGQRRSSELYRVDPSGSTDLLHRFSTDQKHYQRRRVFPRDGSTVPGAERRLDNNE